MLESETAGDFGDVGGLTFVDGRSSSDFDGTESAGAGAGFPEDHEGRRLLRPALGQVWTARAFADGMQVFRPHHALDFFDRVGARQPDGQPLRQSLGHTDILREPSKRFWESDLPHA